MRFETLAELALTLHFVWIVWLAAGLPLGLSLGWPRLRLLHGASAVGQLGVQLTGVGCPISTLERWLRGGGLFDGGSWLTAWLGPAVYPPLPPDVITAATACWVAATLLSLVFWSAHPAATCRQGGSASRGG